MKDKHYTALVDADTILYSVSAVIQSNNIEVVHKATGRKKMFKNITSFRDWLKTDSKGVNFKEEDFSWSTKPEVTEDVANAMHTIKLKIQAIENEPWCKDIKLYIGGEGNFRKDIYPDYKAKRGAKPLAFQQCRDYMLKKWAGKIFVCDGVEAEDVVGWEATKAYEISRKAKDRDAGAAVICHVDKDVNMVCGYHYNYQKPELGVWWVDSLTAYKAFAKQMLIGDRATDNIPGVDVVTPEMKEVFGIKTKSIGEATANKILEGLETEKDLFCKIVEVYKMAYGDEWKQKADLTGKLVWIMREEREPFDLQSELSRLKLND
jgi:5'-3' exonuclease